MDDYTSLTVFPIGFYPEMSHDFDFLSVEDLWIVDNCMIATRFPS
jgi:hypothetical protein